MNEKSQASSHRRYPLIDPRLENEHESISNSSCEYQQLIPISLEHVSTPGNLSSKRRRSSITSEASRINPISTSHDDFLDHRISSRRKRSAQDDIDAYPSSHGHRDHERYTNKRTRYECSRSIELENQPPRSSLTSHSFLLNHSHDQTCLSSTWLHPPVHHALPMFLNDFIPSHSISHSTAAVSTSATHHPYHPTTNHVTHDLFPSLISNDSSLIFPSHHRSSSTGATNSKMRLLSSQSNGNCPLRMTNPHLDDKQQTASAAAAASATSVRLGNISPAHSDSSSESTSTCSSDELQYQHYHFAPFRSHTFLPPQPWRTYRERENYEQLIDLAEKLSDPNRFKQVDIEQFFSYRYKSQSIPSDIVHSKQTACVICMSHFKTGQHIRVLPCQHEYHSKCIARWFTMNSSCPICRRDNFLA